MPTRGDVLRLLIDDLQRFEHAITALTQENYLRLRASRAHLEGSMAQMLSRSKAPNAPRRQNGSLLP